MKHLLLSLTLLLSLNGYNLNIHSFVATFTQTITTPNDVVTTYKGSIALQEPYLAKWEYNYPIDKSIYIHNLDVVMVEPDLEQAIMSRMEQSINLFLILKKATKVSPTSLEATYQDRTYTIQIRNNFIQSISYTDELDNRVLIAFSNQINNKKLDSSTFKYHIPPFYDIIKQ
jgi:outer membrane lipoprotein carrier protein